jgi:hypothetical protein
MPNEGIRCEWLRTSVRIRGVVNWAALAELLAETTFMFLLFGLGLLAHALGGFHDLQAGVETSIGVFILAVALARRNDQIRMRSARRPK